MFIACFLLLISSIAYTSEHINPVEIQQICGEYALAKFGLESSDLTLTAHKVTIVTPDSKIKKRTIYDLDSITHAWVNFNNSTIAPKKFCRKVALLAAEYDIQTPLIPLVQSFPSQPLQAALYNLHIGKGNCVIVFSKEYAKQEDHSYLKFILGHELSHQIYDNTDNERYLARFVQSTERCLPFVSLKNSIFIALTHTCIDNPYIYYPFMLLFSAEIASSVAIMIATYKTAKRAQAIELACDKHALDFFGKTTEEQIDIAQEGIECLSLYPSFKSYFVDLLEACTNTFRSHPSKYERIQLLKKIIRDLSKT